MIIFLFLGFLGRANMIDIPSTSYKIDNENKIILSNYNLNLLQNTQTSFTGIHLNENYKFIEKPDYLEIGNAYLITNEENQVYTLYFTELPIISISTDFTIVDTPKVLAQFTLIETDKEEISTSIGIEFRGASSQAYPKKSLEIEFWETPDGSSTTDIPILGMMNHDSFNLQALYTEDSRIRSKSANELWLKMSSLSYQNKEPDAKNGILMKYVEVFMNGQYYGIYALSEKVNRKNLKLKKYKDSNIKGELYKGDDWGITTMCNVNDYDNTSDTWGGFEYKHPKEEIDWSKLHNLISFVVESDQETFLQEISSKFEIENAIDYFIFLNFTRAIDNTGKNLYISKYDENSKYFYVPWDLDSTFGYSWDMTQQNVYQDLLTNCLYDRLLRDDNFKKKLVDRWFDLRADVLSISNINSLLESNADILSRNKVYERESIVWNFNYNENSLDYMKDWQKNRAEYLDSLFSSYLFVDNVKNNENNLKYYPNPAKNELNINLSKKESMEIQIYNTTGTLVHTEKTNSKENSINTSKLPNGIYFVNCTTDHFKKQFKIIIAK